MTIGVIFVLCVIGIIYSVKNDLKVGIFLTFVGLMVALVIYLVAILVLENEEKWKEFIKEHHCKVIRKETGSYHSGTAIVGGKVGFGSSYTAGKTTYLCDDGIEYVR